MQEDWGDTVIRVSAPPSRAESGPDDTILVPRTQPQTPPRHGRVPATPVRGASGPIYRFRIADTVVGLDETVYVGRNPSRPRVAQARMLRLVAVPSARNQVSASHLEIRQRGGSVVVTDLASTNGSVVHIPGRQPRTLRRGESMVVSPGTLIDIGDGNVIEILPMQRP